MQALRPSKVLQPFTNDPMRAEANGLPIRPRALHKILLNLFRSKALSLSLPATRPGDPSGPDQPRDLREQS